MPDLKLLDPKALARIARMELVARQAVEGFLSGKHPSPYHGSSVEYADHRPYSVGDEIRSIDWKLLAKTDKHYVKLYEEQTNVRATILLDMSRSMAMGMDEPKRAAPTKWQYAGFLAASLSYLLLKQNDAVGLVLFDNEVRQYLPGRTTPSHFRHMVELIGQTEPRLDTHIGPVLHEMASRLTRRGIVILISDLLDDIPSLTDGLAHFRYNRTEVIVFHVMDPVEVDFPFDRLTRFRDLEGAGVVVANARSIRKQYLQRLQQFLDEVRAACLRRDIGYQFARTDTPCEQMLTAYLHERGRMRK
ncbi:MAG: DUF58 domain-containing protein [Phycisphaeraceae bacterium]|nr:DUF58 domain-containing protein [Phycisphaeraceae bacterium]